MPNAQHFSIGKSGVIIAETCLPIDPNDENHEHYYQAYGDRLEKAFMEAMEYVRETKESDYEWRNFPLYGLDPDKEKGPLKLALIDHDMRESAEWGLLGYDRLNRRGLIRCLPDAQARKVADTLSQLQPKKDADFSRAQEVFQERQDQIKKDKKLKEFYVSKGIQGQEELMSSSGNNSQQQSIIADINRVLRKRNAKSYLTLKGLRTVRLKYSFNNQPHALGPFDTDSNWHSVQSGYENLKLRGEIFDFSYRLKQELVPDPFGPSYPLRKTRVVAATITVQA